MSDTNPYPSSTVPQAEEDRARFAIHHVIHCPECTTVGWCDTYRAMLADLFGADLAAAMLADGGDGK